MTEITREWDKIQSGDVKIELTPLRRRALMSHLNLLYSIVEANSSIIDETGQPAFRLKREDLESVGEMDFLLKWFYGDDVPEQFSKYTGLISQARGIYEDRFDSAVEAKLRRDEANLEQARSGNVPYMNTDLPYVRSLINIVQSQRAPQKSRLFVLYEGQPLYESEIPDGTFKGLPLGTNVYFDYTSQGLQLNLARTLEESDMGAKVEKPVREQVALNIAVKRHIDDVLDEINQALK